MTPRNRKLLAAIAGLIFVLVGFPIAFVGHFFIASLGDMITSPNTVPNWSIPDERSNFYLFFISGLIIAAGISVTALLWSPRSSYSSRCIIYISLLAILLPVSVFNYAHADFIVNRSAQALLNIFLVLGGSIVVTELYLLKSPARDLLALQILAVLSLSLTAVFIPATFSIIWLLNTLGVISETNSKSLGIPTISTISGALSAVVGYVKFRRELKNEPK